MASQPAKLKWPALQFQQEIYPKKEKEKERER